MQRLKVTPMSKNSCEVSQETSQVINLATANLLKDLQTTINQGVKAIC